MSSRAPRLPGVRQQRETPWECACLCRQARGTHSWSLRISRPWGTLCMACLWSGPSFSAVSLFLTISCPEARTRCPGLMVGTSGTKRGRFLKEGQFWAITYLCSGCPQAFGRLTPYPSLSRMLPPLHLSKMTISPQKPNKQLSLSSQVVSTCLPMILCPPRDFSRARDVPMITSYTVPCVSTLHILLLLD